MALGILYNNMAIYSIFYLLQGDYRILVDFGLAE